jgi:hypothetical protein
VPDILADREDAVPPNLSELASVFSNWLALHVRRGPRGQPFPADGEDAVPPAGTSWEGHSPLCPVFLRTVRTRSLPTCRSSQGYSPIGSCRFGTGRRGSLSLRTAGTPSLPWDLVGGAQSSVPDILADREDAVPPNLSELARAPSDWGTLQLQHGPRGQPFPADGEGAVPPVGTSWEGHSPLCPILFADREHAVPPLPAPLHPRGRIAVLGGRLALCPARGLHTVVVMVLSRMPFASKKPTSIRAVFLCPLCVHGLSSDHFVSAISRGGCRVSWCVGSHAGRVCDRVQSCKTAARREPGDPC